MLTARAGITAIGVALTLFVGTLSAANTGAAQPPPARAAADGSAQGDTAIPDADPVPAARKATGRWAHPRKHSKIFKRPSSKSAYKGRLHFLTEDGFPEVYLVMRQAVVGGREWVKIGIPARPNGQTGWVNRSSLGEIRTSYRILTIDRHRYRAKLWENRDGGVRKLLWSAPVGVGAYGTPTPRGSFWIREKITGFYGGTIYGPLAFGTSAYSRLSDWPGGGVVGIHGTNEPGLIPGAISHGCIRVRNGKVVKLGRRLGVGTPVRIK